MKLLMVANMQKKGRWSNKYMLPVLYAQIENSLDLGWKPRQIMLVTNFKFKWNGVKSIQADLNKHCLTGSKMFGMKWVFNCGYVKETIWAHDLDCWQNDIFLEPKFADVGICTYSNSSLNGGSVFWKPKSLDIIDEIIGILETGQRKEEPTLNEVLKRKSIKKRVTILNETYNVGCSGFVPRFLRAEKPIKVCHLNPYNRIAWETHRLDRNGVGLISISDRMEKILRKYFPFLAETISTEGEERSKYHRERAFERHKNLLDRMYQQQVPEQVPEQVPVPVAPEEVE